MTDDPADDTDADFVADDTERTPRLLAEDLITRAFQLSCLDHAFTDAELEELTMCLAFALVQLKKLPGGPDAVRRANDRARAEIARRSIKPSRVDVPAGTDAEGASNFLGKTVVSVQLGTGEHAIMRAQGFRNDSPIYWCPQCGKLWRSEQCPVHPGAVLQILGFDDKAGP